LAKLEAPGSGVTIASAESGAQGSRRGNTVRARLEQTIYRDEHEQRGRMMKTIHHAFLPISILRIAGLTASVITIGFSTTVSLYANEAAADTVRKLEYHAHHPVFGDIGTYSNAIERSGATTTVRTSVHLKVTALGVVLHLEDAERIEQWKGDRLIYFRGTTTTNGDVVEVKGEARGDTFVITSPSGNVTAPATIFPSNPSYLNFLHSSTIMRTDTGKIEKVHISGGDPILVNIDGTDTWAHKYQIDGSIPYEIWIDQQNVPIKFTVDDDSGVISFTLTK
jgi:hypothetical protein